ncbi:MAG: lipopolysaccharide biosynthesis protein [Bacteroides sp.]|nr:lipopolysaccharide biosynthesis protein [Bacteroides sp.]
MNNSETLKKQAVKGAFWTSIEKFSSQILQFVIGIILARLLSPSDFGVVGMLSVFLLIAQNFIDSGFSIALIRKSQCTENDYSTAFYFNIFVGIVLYFLFFFSSGLIADFYNVPELENLTKFASLNLLIMSFSIAQRAIFIKKINFKIIAIVSLISVSVSGAIGIFLAYNNGGIWSLVVQALLNSLLTSILFWLFSEWRPRLLFSITSFREMFLFGSKLLLTGLLSTFMSNLISLIIGKRYTSSDLGYYSRADKFSQVPTSALGSIFQSVLYPVFSKVQGDNNASISIQRKTLKTASCLIFFLMILLAALSQPIILFFLTSKWIDAVIILQLLCFYQMFSHIHIINIILIQIGGRSDVVLKCELIGIPITLLVLFVFMNYGLVSLCIGYIIIRQIKLFISLYYTGKFYSYGYVKQMKDNLPYFFISIFCVSSVMCFVSYCNISGYCIQILLTTVMSILLYILFLYVKRDEVLFSLLSLMKKNIWKK